jgi:hypothetical protein
MGALVEGCYAACVLGDFRRPEALLAGALWAAIGRIYPSTLRL